MPLRRRAALALAVALAACGDDDPVASATSTSTSTATSTSTSGTTADTAAATTAASESDGVSATATAASASDTAAPACGDGNLDPGEACDDGDLDDGDECTSKCLPALCGDGFLHQGVEACDGADLGGQTCEGLGFDGGDLACAPGCVFDTAACAACGDGELDPGEACDDGNTASGDGCDATCQEEPQACDPDGTYAIQGAPVAYTCCLGLVSVNITSFILSGDGAAIASSPSNPVTMTGAATTCPAGALSNSGQIAGGCTETFKVAGAFQDANTWTGTYAIEFQGEDCSCFGGMLGTPCVNQTFPITAKR